MGYLWFVLSYIRVETLKGVWVWGGTGDRGEYAGRLWGREVTIPNFGLTEKAEAQAGKLGSCDRA